jgi:hypothetical protein
MAFNIFATATSDIPLSNLDANFTLIGAAAAASTLYPTASTSITYGTAGTTHNFSGSGLAVTGTLSVTKTTNYDVARLTAPDIPTLDLYQSAQSNAAARNWRILTNYEAWGQLDIQVGTTSADAPSVTRLSLTSSGNLGIGTSSPGARLDVAGSTYIRGDSTNATFTGPGQLAIKRSSGDPILSFHGNTGAQIGNIQFQDAGTCTIGVNVNQALAFTTNSTERARIDSSGNLLVGTTTTSLSSTVNGFVVNSNGTVNAYRSGGVVGYFNRNTSDGTILSFRTNDVERGSVSISGAVTSYNTTSDQRLKENIQDADSASSLIDALQVRKFDWRADSSHQRYGFVAQELLSVAPEAVHQPTDTEQMMAVDYSKLVPMLVKEIQSLRKRITALEAR